MIWIRISDLRSLSLQSKRSCTKRTKLGPRKGVFAFGPRKMGREHRGGRKGPFPFLSRPVFRAARISLASYENACFGSWRIKGTDNINPWPEWIRRFLWRTMIRVISDHWSRSRSPPKNAPIITWTDSSKNKDKRKSIVERPLSSLGIGSSQRTKINRVPKSAWSKLTKNGTNFRHPMTISPLGSVRLAQPNRPCVSMGELDCT